jgi:hypothetical protein
VVHVLGKYPNICASVEPIMTLSRDYTPAMNLRICLTMACLAPSHAPSASWDDILEYATNLDLDEWPELIDAATMSLKMSLPDYNELIQAFKGLDRLSTSSN